MKDIRKQRGRSREGIRRRREKKRLVHAEESDGVINERKAADTGGKE